MKKLLFIRYKKAGGVKDGGEVGHASHYAAVCELLGKENVVDYYVNDLTKRRSLSELAEGLWGMVCNRYMGLTKRKCEEIRKLAEGVDYVLVDRSVFGYVAKYLKTHGCKAEILCFFHNVEVQYFTDKMSKWVPWRWLVLRCVDANDRMSCAYADKVGALNKRDAQELEARYGRKVDVLIPVSVEDRQPEKSEELVCGENLNCLFVGAYFTANVEGVKWFVREVMSRVDVRLTIVGKGMSRLQIKHGDVRVLSDVPDLKTEMEQADVVVLPIFKGSGMKVKTCESLMWGKNIVGTREAFMGYDVDKKKVGGECDTAADFAHALERIRDGRWRKWNAESRNAYETLYSPQAVMKAWRLLIK